MVILSRLPTHLSGPQLRRHVAVNGSPTVSINRVAAFSTTLPKDAATQPTSNSVKLTTPSPSVMNLLKSNGISKEDSYKIQGTGPKGRLLKGDVLAHLGKIQRSAPRDLEARISKISKLDLSNIKIAPKPEPPEKKPASAATVIEPPTEIQMKLAVSLAGVAKVQEKLQEQFRVQIPLSKFIANATAAANTALPPVKGPPTFDDLFDEILGIPKNQRKIMFTQGSFTPLITPLPNMLGSVVEVARSPVDIYDVLTGDASDQAMSYTVSGSPKAGIVAGGKNLFTLNVSKAEEERARVFLDRVKGLLELTPEKLIL
jgi:hypothetical protein